MPESSILFKQSKNVALMRHLSQLFSLLFFCCILSCTTASNDEAAIKTLLEKEAATWRLGDVKAHASCWQVQPYSKILVSLPNGSSFDVPAALMLQSSPNMGQGGYAVMSNLKMKIEGKMAWVSHDEISTSKDSSKSYSHEIRMLEKIDGQWKLVGQSIHIYQPTP